MEDEDSLSSEQYKQAIVTIQALPSQTGTFQFKTSVDLLGLPDEPYGGHEVVVEFQIDNFNNNKTFYTDSNGLDMQERILNYRPTWDLIGLNYAKWNDNITANFYPINSAIQLKDWTREDKNGCAKLFTVMNDRSQSGTSLSDGSIQLMQNRRLYADDHKGVGEPLNERQPNH